MALIAGLSALPHQAHAQTDPISISLTKTASPTTYSAAGQVITYTYVVTNTTGFDSFSLSIALRDDKVPEANISCPANTNLSPGESMTCTGSYTITAADVTAGSVTNIAQATGTVISGQWVDPNHASAIAVADNRTPARSLWDTIVDQMNPIGIAHASVPSTVQATASATVTYVANSSITIIKKAIKGSGTFTFVSATPALAMQLTTGDIVSSGAKTLLPGTYTITELQDVPFFYLGDISCNDPDGGTTTSVANATAVIDLDAGENITCTFTNIDPRPQTKAVIERFLHHRLTSLLDNDPDRPRFIRRFPGSAWGGGPGGNSSPVNVAMSETGGNMSFSTSLGQIASAMANADQAKQSQAMGLGSAALNERPGPAPYKGIDIWTEGHFSKFNDDIGNGNADGDFDILYVGADIPLTTNLLVGVLGQFDWAKEHTKIDSSKAEGKGWMVGPYLSARLDEHLFFDWRAAWGQSDNTVALSEQIRLLCQNVRTGFRGH